MKKRIIEIKDEEFGTSEVLISFPEGQPPFVESVHSGRFSVDVGENLAGQVFAQACLEREGLTAFSNFADQFIPA